MTNVDRAHFFSVNKSYLDNVRTFNYLGITLDSNMTLGSLFALVTRKVSMKIYNLVKIRNFIDVNCALTIYKQTILPLLDYAGFMLIFSIYLIDKISQNYRMMP